MKKACLVFIIKDNLGGAERRLTRSFDAINNCEVDIIVWDRSKDIKYFTELSNYRIFAKAHVYRVKNPISLCLKIVLGKYDWVCYIDCSGTIPIIPLSAKLSGAKRLWILASTVFTNIDKASKRHKKLFKRFSKYASRLDCLFPSRVESLQEMFPMIKCTSTPIPFTDSRYFVPKRKENIIVFLSRLISIKHPMEAVMAANEIKDELRNRKFKLIICGKGPLYNNVNDYVIKNDLQDIVDVPGYLIASDVIPQAKVFLSLQDFTNYPSQSLIEAISCGCWCIATNVGETELLVKDYFGELVDLNINSISKAILRAIEKTDSLEYVDRELQFAKENFDIMKSANYYAGIINNEGK